MALKIKKLSRPCAELLQKNTMFDEDNPSFNKAFKRHYNCAAALANASFYREAYLIYLLSVECLLKDLYVLARAEILGPDLKKSPAAILINAKNRGNKTNFADLLKTKKFSHDLASLIQFTKDIFPELEKKEKLTRFAALSVATNVQLDWISERYKDPDSNDENWSDYCTKIHLAIKNFVNNDLSNLYEELPI